MAQLTITNGRVIDPASGIDAITDVVIDAGQVVKLDPAESPGTPGTADGPVLDATGLIVAPGLIDPHVHLREPGQEEKETIATGAAAAVNGGFTTICCMPNTQPALDDDGRVEFVYRQAARANLCNVHTVGAVTKGREGHELAEIGLMARAGAVAFSDDGTAVASAGVMARALRYVASTGRAFMQHCEEPTLTQGGVMNAGTLATRLGLGGWPAVAEELIIQRDIMLNQAIRCRYHVQHLTTAGGVEIVRQARRRGEPVTAEVSPHHMLLTEQACAEYNTLAKMNPPLRTQADVEALLEGVRDGTITVLATDHAPHTDEDKQREFAAAPFGIIGLDCALPLYVKALIEPGIIDWPRLIDMMTHQPAQLCQLPRKGTLAQGADADVTLIDPERQWTIDVSRFASRSRNCPFDRWQVKALPIATIVNGQLKLNRDPHRLSAA